MSDENLIAEIARVWVAGGGDSDGIDWCHRRIKEAVAEEMSRAIDKSETCDDL